jgi:hypothetical protein
MVNEEKRPMSDKEILGIIIAGIMIGILFGIGVLF